MDQGINTDITRSTAPHEENMPIGQVQTGMKVVDAAGNDIGKVDDLKMGDPQAATDLGEYPDQTKWGLGIFGLGPSSSSPPAAAEDPDAVAGPGIYPGEPHVPFPAAARLLREGYLKINGGLFHGDYYAAASTIRGVSNDTVQLAVAKDQLPKS